MPAHRRYETPATQLRRLAVEARAEGLPFSEFWRRALRPGQSLVTRHWAHPPKDCVVWPRDTYDRSCDREAIKQTRAAWRRAYLNLPPSRNELALQVLAPVLEGFDPPGETDCAHEREHVAA